MPQPENPFLTKRPGYLIGRQRIVFEGGVYHITQRAPGKELIFLEEGDYLCFLKILKKAAAKYSLKVFCFALLTNHLHLLLQVTQKNLSVSMKSIFETYAVYFNKKYERKGHVFCGRFRASLCNSDAYILAASIYIHLNPLRAGLCRDIGDYRWTSVNLYLTLNNAAFIKHENVLDILDKDPRQSCKRYEEALLRAAGSDSAVSFGRQYIQNILRSILKTIGREGLSKDRQVCQKTIENLNQKRILRRPSEQRARRYVIEQLWANGYDFEEILGKLDISRATYYRIMRQTA